MRWRRFFSECLLVSLVAVALETTPTTAAAYSSNNKPSFDEDECEEVLPCHKCSIDEKDQVRECGASSGKIVTLSCPHPERDGT